MDTAEKNAIRSVARKCWKEIHEAWKDEAAKSRKQRDVISRRILLAYEKKINPRFTLYQLMCYIGVANGTRNER